MARDDASEEGLAMHQDVNILVINYQTEILELIYEINRLSSEPETWSDERDPSIW